MSIFRVQKNKNYSVISNTFIFDEKLSWKAKGILAYFLARPDEWEFYMTEIVKHAKDGKDSLSAGIKELEKAGYIDRKQKRTTGKFKGYEYEVFEEPQRNNRNGKTAAVNPISENPPIVSTDSTVNTDKTKAHLEFFERVWRLYPNKKGKGQISETQKRKLHTIGNDAITKCIERFAKDVNGRDKQYIQYGSTFFNSGYIDYLDENYTQQDVKENKPAPKTKEEILGLDSEIEEYYKTIGG